MAGGGAECTPRGRQRCTGVAATPMSNLAAIVYTEGNLAEAKALFHEALPRYRKLDDSDGEILLLANLAALLADQADLRAAEDRCQQALTLAQQTNDKRAEGYVLAGLGGPLLQQGETWRRRGRRSSNPSPSATKSWRKTNCS